MCIDGFTLEGIILLSNWDLYWLKDLSIFSWAMKSMPCLPSWGQLYASNYLQIITEIILLKRFVCPQGKNMFLIASDKLKLTMISAPFVQMQGQKWTPEDNQKKYFSGMVSSCVFQKSLKRNIIVVIWGKKSWYCLCLIQHCTF